MVDSPNVCADSIQWHLGSLSEIGLLVKEEGLGISEHDAEGLLCVCSVESISTFPHGTLKQTSPRLPSSTEGQLPSGHQESSRIVL